MWASPTSKVCQNCHRLVTHDATVQLSSGLRIIAILAGKVLCAQRGGISLDDPMRACNRKMRQPCDISPFLERSGLLGRPGSEGRQELGKARC